MSRAAGQSRSLSASEARRIWLRAQRLDALEPFGDGPDATRAAVEHLGYVQIDTINVIERSHHHILYTRIPGYRREHLRHAQSIEKSVFEYWTHALSYIPTRDIRFFTGIMRRNEAHPIRWLSSNAKPEDVRKVLRLIRKGGALTIRDIDDDVLVDKIHPWASRKPSKAALQRAFYGGALTVSARAGMLKTYELMDRHFGWDKRPRPATERECLDYLLDTALRSQGLVSLDSICFQAVRRKPSIRKLIEARVCRKALVPVELEGAGKVQHWASAEALDTVIAPQQKLVHILSPFDPLTIQRKRLELFFGHVHRFEAYVPKDKRVFGYFALPVLVGSDIVAVIDLKTDREAKKLLMQKWTWLARGGARAHKRRIEEELHRFERFQLA